MTGKSLWHLTKQLVLWLGLLVCCSALWRTRTLASDAIDHLHASTWILSGLLIITSLTLNISVWRYYLSAYTGQAPTWRMATRQVGILLIGKYIPGGIFGFLARMYDQPNAPRQKILWAGLAEQVVGIVMLSTIGGILYLCAAQNNYWPLLLALALPPGATANIIFVHHFARRLRWIQRYINPASYPAWRELIAATTIQLFQLTTWAILAATIARDLYHLSYYESIGIAAAFLLAVASGMLAIIAPGGIGVREVVLVSIASQWIETTQAVFIAALLRILSSLLDVIAGVVAAAIGKQK